MPASRIAYKDITVERKPGLWWLDRIESVALETAPTMGNDVVVVTSANDGRHQRQSLHYKDQAMDVRYLGKRPGAIVLASDYPPRLETPPTTWAAYVQGQRKAAEYWAKQMRAKLGADFDVVVEDDHIHAEYDPK